MRIFVLLVAMSLLSVSAIAQNWQEVLYLKNGSAIRGVIIEQKPNESVKIQTADGSIFVYSIDEVAKITKEQKGKKMDAPAEKHKYPNRGYRGFVSGGYIIGDDLDGISLSTIHGFQIFPRLYVGSGIEIQHVDYLDLTKYTTGTGQFFVNAFDHIRCDIIKSPVTPFIDLRLGLRFGETCELYYSPSFGLRFMHFNLSLAYDEIPNITAGSKSNSYMGYSESLIVQLTIDFGSR